VESVLRKDKVLFETLLSRLIYLVNLRIQNGEYTERGLARILGVSQSHIHNVLKGALTLRSTLADRLLSKLGISSLGLLEERELFEELYARRSSPEFRPPQRQLPDPSALRKPVRSDAPGHRSKERAG
jgi:hypothetical protein